MAPPIVGCRYLVRPKFLSDAAQTAKFTREVLVLAVDEHGVVMIEELTNGPRRKSGRRDPFWSKGTHTSLETFRWAFDPVGETTGEGGGI